MIDDAAREAAVVSAVEAAHGERRGCARCDGPLPLREVVVSHAMGFNREPICVACLAEGMGLELAALRAQVRDVILRRSCWRAGWARACRLEGELPAWDEVVPSAAPAAAPDTSEAEPIARWDAGEMACGDLLYELRLRVRELAPGEAIDVIARDPSAPIDLPAWCRVTGHPLVESEHPRYRVRRRAEPQA